MLPVDMSGVSRAMSGVVSEAHSYGSSSGAQHFRIDPDEIRGVLKQISAALDTMDKNDDRVQNAIPYDLERSPNSFIEGVETSWNWFSDHAAGSPGSGSLSENTTDLYNLLSWLGAQLSDALRAYEAADQNAAHVMNRTADKHFSMSSDG